MLNNNYFIKKSIFMFFIFLFFLGLIFFIKSKLFLSWDYFKESNKSLIDSKNFVLIKSKIKILEQDKDSLQAKIDSLSKEKEQEIATLEQDKASLQAKIDSLTNEKDKQIQNLQKEKTNLEATKITLEQDKASLQAKIDSLTNEKDKQIQNLQKEKTNLEATKITLEQDKASLQAKIDSLTNEKDKQIQNLQKEKTNLEATKITLEQDKASLQAKIDSLTNEKDKQIQNLQKEKTNLEATKITLEQDKASLQAKIDSLTNEKDKQIQNLQKEKTNLEATKITLEQDKASLQAKIDSLTNEKDKQIQNLQKEKTNLEATKITLEQDKASLQAKIDSLTNEKKREIKILEATKITLEQDKDSLQAKIDSLTNEKDKQIQNLQKEKTNLEATKITLEQDKDSLQAKIDSLTNEKEQEKAALQKQIINLNNEKKQLEISKTINIPIVAEEPYLTYEDQNGDIIREYKFFENMIPKEKDNIGRINFFSKKDFLDNMDKLKLDTYPIIWNEGIEKLGVLETNEKLKNKGIIKQPNIYKSDYRFIYTSIPNGSDKELLTKFSNVTGIKRGRINDNISFSEKSSSNIDLMSNSSIRRLIFLKDEVNCIRLMTKNLKLSFDWVRLITDKFQKYLPVTKKIIDLLLSNQLVEAKELSERNSEEPKFQFQIENNFQIPSNLYIRKIYNINDFTDFLKKLNLQKSDYLYDIREFVIYNIEKKLYDPYNKYHIQIPASNDNRQFLI
ncbi:predicted outer surface lipoprotein [Candidatus Phytoplasma mali]|uniref:Predicted outer surface lipoprotein n=1 Tax=Phytoplasma mali (strain AT) TaxID=482235 RepID=B3R0R2_PHYMT|nr:outer surface lipoprotein [Candidatus Phytoplasma mali]CAP18646.1 predicted outer surface lipoprotein [Candidatus Phytoplasma mali]